MDLYCHAQFVPWIVWFCEAFVGMAGCLNFVTGNMQSTVYDTWRRVAWYADANVSGDLPYFYIRRDGDKRVVWNFCAYQLNYTASCHIEGWKLDWYQGDLRFHTGRWSMSEICRCMGIDTDVFIWVKESLIKCCNLELLDVVCTVHHPTICIWTNKVHKILVIRLHFPFDTLHISDSVSPSSGATFINCTSHLVYAGICQYRTYGIGIYRMWCTAYKSCS